MEGPDWEGKDDIGEVHFPTGEAGPLEKDGVLALAELQHGEARWKRVHWTKLHSQRRGFLETKSAGYLENEQDPAPDPRRYLSRSRFRPLVACELGQRHGVWSEGCNHKDWISYDTVRMRGDHRRILIFVLIYVRVERTKKRRVLTPAEVASNCNFLGARPL